MISQEQRELLTEMLQDEYIENFDLIHFLDRGLTEEHGLLQVRYVARRLGERVEFTKIIYPEGNAEVRMRTLTGAGQ